MIFFRASTQKYPSIFPPVRCNHSNASAAESTGTTHTLLQLLDHSNLGGIDPLQNQLSNTVTLLDCRPNQSAINYGPSGQWNIPGKSTSE